MRNETNQDARLRAGLRLLKGSKTMEVQVETTFLEREPVIAANGDRVIAAEAKLLEDSSRSEQAADVFVAVVMPAPDGKAFFYFPDLQPETYQTCESTDLEAEARLFLLLNLPLGELPKPRTIRDLVPIPRVAYEVTNGGNFLPLGMSKMQRP